jgi:RHH-type proline utilization regulon transcriptional repressor/proline dehydrogenase/delta 1-pyrroline-5-carboxylate dehydrogenase
VIDWLADLARLSGACWCVRLVKGAYWDSEIKRAQVDGHAGYPVFTRKPNTDVSYLGLRAQACSTTGDAVLSDVRHPQRAHHRGGPSHLRSAGQRRPYEYQRLHGMGEDLYAEVVGAEPNSMSLPRLRAGRLARGPAAYLVRRLLENGANSSFVNRITDESHAHRRD